MFKMTRQEILEFIEANPVAWIATVEDGRPHVRGLRAFRVREDGPLFQISTPKDLYRPSWPRIPRSRRASTTRLKASRYVWPGRRGSWKTKPFVIADATAYSWTRENNFVPKEWVEL